MSPRPGAVSSRTLPSRAPGDTGASDAAAIDRRVRFLCAGYALVTFLFYVVWRHFMGERSADEAIFENLLWNATHGHGLATWVESDGYRLHPHLALHFSPVILLLVPLYQILPSMHIVHFVVCASIALAGALVHRLARARLDPVTSLMLMGAFLLHPTIVLQTFLEFHEQALVVLPLLVMVLGYERGSIGTSLAGALFVLGAREDNALLVLMVGLLALVARNWSLGASLLALAAGWLVLYRWIALEHLGGGSLPSVFAGTYGLWGETPGEALRTILGDPARVTSHLLAPAPLGYLVQLLAPFLLVVGFGHPLALAMLPQLFLILLARHDTRMFEIRLHYSLVPVTMLTVGAIGMAARLGAASIAIAGRRIAGPRLIAGAMLAIAVAATPWWMARAVQRLNPRVEEARAVIALVPDTSSVTAPGYLLNHMAKRRRIGPNWVGPYTLNEYVVFEERRPGSEPGVDLPFSPEVARTLAAAGYAEIHTGGGWHVWRRPPR